MSNRFHGTAALIAGAVIAAASAPASAENAKDILGSAMERYQNRIATTESDTIVQ
jgi:hypothetical protein